MAEAEKNLSIYFNTKWEKVEKKDDVWYVTVSKSDGSKEIVSSRVLIDATELGDIAKECGVAYDLGMESKARKAK